MKSLIFISLALLFCSCDDGPTSITQPRLAVPAPSRWLPASEIFKLEGITSIHYIDYYYSTVNGHADSGFHPEFEFHIDTNRERMNQYYLGTPNWNITVVDLKKGSSWNLYNGALTHYESPNMGAAFEGEIQAFLGSWLNDQQYYVGTEHVGDKLCDVFTDSTGTLEWVWRDHRLPIQRRTESLYNNVGQITYLRKQSIEVNIPLSDSLFDPPTKVVPVPLMNDHAIKIGPSL